MAATTLLLTTGCSTDSIEKEICHGTLVSEWQILEYQYIDKITGELTPYNKGNFELKMDGKRPVIYNLDGTIAQKQVVIKNVSTTIVKENVEYDCSNDLVVTQDAIKYYEEKKEYYYILDGWSQTVEYYIPNN